MPRAAVRGADREATLAPALDGVIAGSIPRYRMTYSLKGVAGTFVSGGTVGGLMRIRVPGFRPAHYLYTSFAAAVP